MRVEKPISVYGAAVVLTVTGVLLSLLTLAMDRPSGSDWFWHLGFVVLPLCVLWIAHVVVVTFIGLRRRRLRRANWCVQCEYNLTGNVSGVCSECGTPILRTPADSGSETPT